MVETEQNKRNQAIRDHEKALDDLLNLTNELADLRHEYAVTKKNLETLVADDERIRAQIQVARKDLEAKEQAKWRILIEQDHGGGVR